MEQGTDSQLALDRLGLRFRDCTTEADYQDWRIGVAIPFVRVGMVASAIIWLGVAASGYLVVPEMSDRIALPVFFAMLPLVLAAFGVTFLPRLRTTVMPVTAFVNSVAGLVAIWQVHELFGIPAAAPTAFIMVAYFALTIFRLAPTLAVLAVVPYLLLLGYYLLGDYRSARLNTVEMWTYTLMPLMTIMTGLLVCAVLEYVTRQTYRSERVIARQQQALMEERAQLSRFLAPEVTRMVRERGIEATLVHETLTLTAVCCDLRGFTTYTEKHGASQMALVLREYYETIVAVAKRYGATVKDFAGDGALILVGAPISRPDHAEVGLQLARELIVAVKRVTDAMSREGAALGVGAGVATGACAVGAIGSQSRLEYTAVGSAVNLASRLCSRAGDAEILIAPATAALVARDSTWRAQPMRLSGFDEPLSVLIETVSAG
ncbi:MAG: adenylate/guanylate cyclase domain-containing protein [bacterium]